MPVLFICIRFNRCCTLLLRIFTWKRKYDHISATIRDQLHWLPVKQRIDHKLCTLIYKCLHNVAPVHLCDMCIPVSSISISLQCRSSLRSAAHGDLWHQRIRQKHLALVLLRCLDHPYGIHCLQLFAIHYWHTDNSAVNWKVLCLIERIWLEQLRLRDNNLL